jgi:hypothetical protein
MNSLPFTKAASIAQAIWIAFALVGCSVASSDGAGPYSALTRPQISTVSDGTALLLPVDLPEGLNPKATTDDFSGTFTVAGIEYHGDDQVFFLQRVVFDADRDAAGTTTVSYRSAVLGEGSEDWYEVTQQSEGAAQPARCRHRDNGEIERMIGGVRLVICSPFLDEGSSAWTYWSKVAFTDNLNAVSWLRG